MTSDWDGAAPSDFEIIMGCIVRSGDTGWGISERGSPSEVEAASRSDQWSWDFLCNVFVISEWRCAKNLGCCFEMVVLSTNVNVAEALVVTFWLRKRWFEWRL